MDDLVNFGKVEDMQQARAYQERAASCLGALLMPPAPRCDRSPQSILVGYLSTLHVIIIPGGVQMCGFSFGTPRGSRKWDGASPTYGNGRYGYYKNLVFRSKIEKCKHFYTSRFWTPNPQLYNTHTYHFHISESLNFDFFQFWGPGGGDN